MHRVLPFFILLSCSWISCCFHFLLGLHFCIYYTREYLPSIPLSGIEYNKYWLPITFLCKFSSQQVHPFFHLRMLRLHCDYHSYLQELLVWDRLARRNSELLSLMMLALEQLLLWLMNWPIRKWFYKIYWKRAKKLYFFLSLTMLPVVK